MRVNIYAEEMTDRIEIITKEVEGHEFTALRFYLELPCTIPNLTVHNPADVGTQNVSGLFIHRPGDDDSAAVTFWGKRDLRIMLRKALAMLDEHYESTKDEPTLTMKLRGRPVSKEEALCSARRLVNSHFHNPDAARISIPVSAADDDVTVIDYIREQTGK